MTSLLYQYRCPTCREEVIEKTYSCPKCGPDGVLIYKRNGTSSFSSLICNCGYEKPQRIPPSLCPKCNQPGCAWWDVDKSNWASLGQSSLSAQDGVWITGDFDGDYFAPKETVDNGNQLSPNLYGLRFVRALVKNIRKVDGPPQDLADTAKSPITFKRLHPVDVAIPTSVGSDLNRVTLLDFRLHDWKLVGSVSNERGNARIGRVSGKAYGVLAPQEPEAYKIDESEVREHAHETLPNNYSTSENILSKSQAREHSSSGTDESSKPEPITSTDKTQKPTQPTQASTPPEQVDSTPIVPHSSCWTCKSMPILLSFLVIWIMCSFKTGAGFVLFNLIVCVLDEIAWKRGLKLVKLWQQLLLTAALLLITGSILYFVYMPKEALDCQQLPTQALGVMTAVVLISLLLPWCWIRTLFVGVFIFLVANWCSNDNLSCKVEKMQEISANPIHRFIIQARDKITDIFHTDINSEIVTSDISSEGVHRISIDEAVRKPNKLKDCRNKVYIPFDFDKSEINAPTQFKLNRLAQTLQRLEPHKIIVSGYSSFDQGDETPEANLRNIQLSMMRAVAVSNSLITNSQMPEIIFESRGFGATDFLSRGEGEASINRRVELSLACEKAEK